MVLYYGMLIFTYEYFFNRLNCDCKGQIFSKIGFLFIQLPSNVFCNV